MHKLLDKEVVLKNARQAQAAGATRFCMGAAWREVRDNRDFDQVTEMVQEINELGLEVCATLGMIRQDQAEKLKEAGLYAYNHNLDTSEDKYGDIISTRQYDDRLRTLDNVRQAGLTVCSGGIIGLGEEETDRIAMLHTPGGDEPASGVGADQQAGGGRWYAVGKPSGSTSIRHGQNDRHGSDFNAYLDGTSVSG